MSITTYQIALVVVLVLSLVFWFLLLIFRLFFHCSSNGVRWTGYNRRNDRRRVPLDEADIRTPRAYWTRDPPPHGINNRGFSHDQGDPLPYSIATEIPPSYEEATKYIVLSSGDSEHKPRIVRMNRKAVSQRTYYERPVTLMVPEEPTSTSENRLQSSLEDFSPQTLPRSTEEVSTTDHPPPSTMPQTYINPRHDSNSIPTDDCHVTLRLN